MVDVPLIMVNTTSGRPINISQVVKQARAVPNALESSRLVPPTTAFHVSPSMGWLNAGKAGVGKVVDQSVVDQSVVDQSVVDQSTMKQSTMKQSTVAQSTTTTMKQPMATQPATNPPTKQNPTTSKEETLRRSLSQLQRSPHIVVLDTMRAAGFGNWVRGLLTMYTIALCRGMGFRCRS